MESGRFMCNSWPRSNGNLMFAIYGPKPAARANNAQMLCKCCDAAAAIATHGTFPPVCIEINHFKVKPLAFLQQYQTISADAKTSVTEPLNEICIVPGQPILLALIDHYEIIACALVFPKFHVCQILNTNQS